jgi:uncharacterized membrane protein YccC
MVSGEGEAGVGRPWWVRLDPEGRAWRNATRGVVMAVPLFATYAALDLVVWAPWAFIGLLNTLLPDIGGPLRPRLRTGIEILVGSVAAAFLGALVADEPVALVAAMFLVAFGAAYIGVLSPYLAAAGTSVLLVFLLSAGSPTDELSSAGWRAANVAIGAVLAVIAIVAVVPAPRRRRVEPALAGACTAVADLLEPTGDRGPAASDDIEEHARTAVTEMVTAVTAQRWPPLSRTRVDRARLAFAHDLQSLFARAVAIHRSDRAGHAPGATDPHRRTAADGLRGLAAWLVDQGPGPDGSALRAAAGSTASIALELRADAAAAVGDPEALDRFRVARRVQDACHLTSVLADGAAAAAFHTGRAEPAARDGIVDVTHSQSAYGQRLRMNLSPDSMTFRHAVRLATACALAVGVEQWLHLVHGYWAVLTVVVTLRTSRGASASRSVDRLLGTVGGVVLASVSIAVAARSEARTAVIMVLTVVALAATLWTGAARLRWAWGVVAITSCVLTMFQLETPGDWPIEAERVIATVLGLTIALGVAYLLWPGSSAIALRRAIGAASESLATLAASVRESALGRSPAVAVADARRRSDRLVLQARTTLGAAGREGSLGSGSTLTTAVLELEQAAELMRRIDDSLTGTFRTPPVGPAAELVEATTGAAERGLRAAAAAFGTGEASGSVDGADVVAAHSWRALPPGTAVEPQVLDAVADLGTLGHRGADLAALGGGPDDGAVNGA